MSHTPGPWTISSTDSTTVDIRCSREILVAEVGNTSLEDEANARLIAAAPTLADALRFILADLNSTLDPEARMIAEAALAKAEG